MKEKQHLIQNNNYTNDILKTIADLPQLPEIDTYMTQEDVAQGFRRWHETTSTSPSGCHLGLRRIPAFSIANKEIDKMCIKILQVQTAIIYIPVSNGFSPNRWQSVVNAMLEKTPGQPLLHKLRVIHILEADYNLTLKAIFGQHLMQICEKHGTLGDLQDGFRKGRSTTRTLLHNEIVNDYNKRRLIDSYIGMTDISGCFDRIIPSITALLNRKNGYTAEAVQMHSQTLYIAKYFLKTQHGVSQDFYSNIETPVYGNGQGAGDSPSQWSQESSLLFQAYSEKINGAHIVNKDGVGVSIPLAAFADDTNLLGNDEAGTKTLDQMTTEVQKAFTHWNGLLHATGHFMELSKCACYLLFWKFQEDGYAYTMDPDEHRQLVTVVDNQGKHHVIPQLKSNETQKLLGAMKCPIGDQQDEIHRLKNRSDNIARRINTSRLTRSEARLAYEVFYLPALRYSLNITAINQVDMERIQSKATLAFLAAQGYNRHMPREIVYAPRLYQGTGTRHLFDVQGSDSTCLLLQEMNHTGSTANRMLHALIQTIQLESGIGEPILENCRPLDYIEWGWIVQIRDFLHHIGAQIIGATEKPLTFRENDSYLMDSPYLMNLTRRERIYIHRCRIHQQVESVSDIATADGMHIHTAWYAHDAKKPSRSLIKWPRQDPPFKRAWQTWKKFLLSFLNSSGKLREPLGKWVLKNKYREYVAYIHMDTKSLWIKQADKWKEHHFLRETRTTIEFSSIGYASQGDKPSKVIPADLGKQNDTTPIKTANILKQQMEKVDTNKETKINQWKKWYERTSPQYEHLVGKIDWHIDQRDITKTLSISSTIIMASDTKTKSIRKISPGQHSSTYWPTNK